MPVGVGTFSAAEGELAFRLGADIAVIGVPVILETDVEDALRAYVDRSKSAWSEEPRR